MVKILKEGARSGDRRGRRLVLRSESIDSWIDANCPDVSKRTLRRVLRQTRRQRRQKLQVSQPVRLLFDNSYVIPCCSRTAWPPGPSDFASDNSLSSARSGIRSTGLIGLNWLLTWQTITPTAFLPSHPPPTAIIIPMTMTRPPRWPPRWPPNNPHRHHQCNPSLPTKVESVQWPGNEFSRNWTLIRPGRKT